MRWLVALFVLALTMATADAAEATPQYGGNLDVAASPNPAAVGQTVVFTVTGMQGSSTYQLCGWRPDETFAFCDRLDPLRGAATRSVAFGVAGSWFIQVIRFGRSGKALQIVQYAEQVR